MAVFGKTRVPGLGFGMGDVTLMDFLETHGLLPKARLGAVVQVMAPPASSKEAEATDRARVKQLAPRCARRGSA